MERDPKGDVLSRWPWFIRPLGRVVSFLPFTRTIWKELPEIPDDFRWLCYLVSSKLRLAITSESQTKTYKEFLVSHRVLATKPPQVTVTFSSRKLGNRDSHVESLLGSFVATTSHPERFEFLIKVDDDDDLFYFRRIKRQFAQLNLRFFVTSRGKGYYDVIAFNSFLIDQASHSSKVWFGLSDDAVFCRDGWDADVFDLIQAGGEFMIGSKTPEDQVNVIGPLLVAPNPGYLYDCEPYPMASWNLIEELRTATEDLDGWSALGILPASDLFLAGIDAGLRIRHDKNVYHQIGKYCDRRFRRVSWANDPARSAAVSRVLEAFWEASAVETRNLIVDRIHQAMSQTKGQPQEI